jgi:hypothetical protein
MNAELTQLQDRLERAEGSLLAMQAIVRGLMLAQANPSGAIACAGAQLEKLTACGLAQLDSDAMLEGIEQVRRNFTPITTQQP